MISVLIKFYIPKQAAVQAQEWLAQEQVRIHQIHIDLLQDFHQIYEVVFKLEDVLSGFTDTKFLMYFSLNNNFTIDCCLSCWQF